MYVGASGAVFGFLGLYLADVALNWETMHRPLLRLALMLTALGLTLGVEFAAARVSPLLRVSHMSHVGGLIAGLFTSFVFLPNLTDRRWRAARRAARRISESLAARLSGGGAGAGAGGGGGSSTGAGSGSGSGVVLAPWGHGPTHERVRASCWRRHAWLYWSCYFLSALVMLFMFCGLPLYVWIFVMPSLRCPPLTVSA